LVSYRVMSGELEKHVGASIRLCGWVHRRRELARVTFLVVRDRAGLAQVVVPPGVPVPGEESVVEVTGTVVANEVAPGGFEVAYEAIEVLAEAEPPPVELFRPAVDAGLPALLDHAAVALRHPARRAVFAASAAAVKAFRSTLDGLGFTEIQTPKIVGTATESGANVFALDYFGRPAYLAQSPQFYKQTMVGVFERVYEVGPVFRAEPHDTSRHLATYTSLDAELGFVRDHRDVMAVLTRVVRAMSAAATAGLPGVEPVRMPDEVPVVHFAEALRLVGADPAEPDLAPEHERALGAWALAEHGSDFVYVEGYPMAKRPFYTHPQPSDPRWSNSFDLLFRGMELVTGGQRRHRYADYLEALGPQAEALSGDLAAYRHGMPPHGGFAIGLERFLARLTGAANVRETTLFPRDLHRLAP
jgi:nondiscriminating aspartyl-tRNA synthetase